MATAPRPRSTTAPAFRRVVLKLSGEALMGKSPYGIDTPVVMRLAGRDRKSVV